MKIRQYNMGFGECFLLTSNDNKGLIVDCGSINMTQAAGTLDEICKDLSNIQYKEALITHFHRDHIDGFLELTKRKGVAFKKLYIPNIFDLEYPNYVTVDLLEGLLTDDIEVNRMPLIQFLESIVSRKTPIELLDRRKNFCVGSINVDVLWPVIDLAVNKRSWNRIQELVGKEENEEFWGKIESVTGDICDLIQEVAAQGDTNLDSVTEIITILEGLKIQNEKLDEKTKEIIIRRLHNLAHESNVVFHCEESGKRALFTGDIKKTAMRKIAQNSKEPSKPVYKDYYIYKAPHHGTQSPHYFNFSPYFACEYVAVSNGDAPKGYHKITNDYNHKSIGTKADYQMDCINSDPTRCECFINSGSCDNCNYCNIRFSAMYNDIL